MNWTDSFLIPFYISLNNLLIKSREIIEQTEISKNSEELRRSLLACVNMSLGSFTIDEKYLMLSGRHIGDSLLTDIRDEIIKFKETDDIIIDTLDKMIIDDLIDHINIHIKWHNKLDNSEFLSL